MENKKKTRKTGIILGYIALILIIIGLIIYILFDKGIILNNSNNKKDSNKTVEDKKEVVEKQLENETTKNELKEKIAAILGVEYTDESVNKYSTDRTKILTDKSSLTDDYKLEIAINNIKQTNIPTNVTNIDIDPIESLGLNNNTIKEKLLGAMQVSVNEVEEKYKELFGTDIKEFKSLGTTYKQPLYVYDKGNNVYYIINVGGSTTTTNTYLYNNKYTTKGDNAYVYVNFGISEYNIDTNLYDIYKDAVNKTIYKAGVDETSVSSFKIDSSNYKEFSEYKFQFTKNNDGSYYFSNVESN